MKQIKKMMVANRGEIAVRIFRAGTELDIRTVAVYTYEDRYSLHRYKADEAYQIGENNDPLKPYLDIEEIIHVAKQNNVDAIHPGYGFLSENVTFVRRCNEEGIIFIGPSVEAMEQLGDKVKAKNIARKANVPVIESNATDLVDINTAIQEAERIGYPVLIKAVVGGGGRGMRIVHNSEDLKTAFHAAKREAKTAFGSEDVFIEKFIEDPKHIEVQILGDKQGNIIHLHERDCSVQRRFQKVVEVAPAPSLQSVTKRNLHNYALAIAKTVDYYNAGTVEFLIDKAEQIYFIEVNPRIQVEHTVTEEVTGIDIVRSQILIAAGHKLSSNGIYINSQQDVNVNGFAIQCRITTEDPANNFKPDYGRLIAYRNATGFNIRLDEGSAYNGAIISPFFDSMLTKVTASGRTLKGAAQRLDRALQEFRVRGVKTNIPFLENVINHPVFISGNATVNFIKEEEKELFTFTRKRNRATKLLRYLANVAVNGNSDVRFTHPNTLFHDANVPPYNRLEDYTPGSKQLLNRLGPTELAKWLRNTNEVQLTDTTFRDAHQSLLATRMRTRDMLAVAESFTKNHPNIFSMEVWGGATFDVALRFLHEDPWQRLSVLRQAMPNVLLQMLLRGSNAVGYTAYPDNLVEQFIETAAEKGIDIFRIFDALNWLDNMKVSIKAVRERTNAIAEACICYTGDMLNKNETKYTLNYYKDLAKALEDEGAHILAIKDMAGLLKPAAAGVLVNELRNTVQTPIHLHTHDTSSAQLATYLKAIDAGVDAVDVALASMSGLTSQPSFNTLVEILDNHDRAPQFNTASLNRFSDYWQTVRSWYYPFESGLRAGTADVYKHEIPGGQYSNLYAQAQSLGLSNQMSAITSTYHDVNKLFGNLIKVTPISKVVGDMALYLVNNSLSVNDILTKGDEISFPASVKSFFRGELGQPHGGFPKEVQQIVLKGEEPMQKRANAYLEPIDFDEGFKTFQQQFPKTSFTDYLSHLLYPKVFENYYNFYKTYSDVSLIPSLPFFYGMQPNEEITVEIDAGKTLLIQLDYISEPNDKGKREVQFKLNGQHRVVMVQDHNIQVDTVSYAKAEADNPKQIGSPLQGLLSKILVKVGDVVEKNQSLLVIEAMKMETTVTASKAGKVEKLPIPEGTMVDNNDLLVELQ